jgi:hypothetical protein
MTARFFFYSHNIHSSPAYGQSSADWTNPPRTGVLANIQPLLTVGLLGSNDMIEEPPLPVWCWESRGFQDFRNRVF